jgi:GxxExxY protein
MPRIIHEQLSGAIIGIAMEVLYERAMAIELRRRGHEVSVQQSYPVFYQSELIGTLVPDLIVDRSIIVDSKVVSLFTDTTWRK